MERIKKKTETITIRVSKAEKDLVEKTAVENNMSITDLFLTTIKKGENDGNR